MRASHFVFILSAAMTTAALIACSSSSVSVGDDGDAGAANQGTTIPPMATGSTGGGATGAIGTGLATGLPCDVQAVLESRCITCHGGPAVGGLTSVGAPPLMTFADITAKSVADPAKTRAELSVEYLTAKKMPPAPAVPAEDDEIAAFADWVKAGSPQNAVACTDPPPLAGDAGAPDAGVICTSGKTWTKGDDGSREMHPGHACNACHQLNDGPNLRVAGTVYKTAHEPNDCNGVTQPPKLTVIITDSRNKTYRIDVNDVGNFLTNDRVRPPLRAMVSDGKATRAMKGSVTSGDCNSCHTQAGANGAPGRIMAP